jgi:hypothetical protein
VADAADRRALHTAADLQLSWLLDEAACLAAIRAPALPPGEGYVWAAGEGGMMAELRRILVDEKGHDSARSAPRLTGSAARPERCRAPEGSALRRGRGTAWAFSGCRRPR